MIGLASFRFSWEVVAWNLPHTNKGTSRREHEQFVPIAMPTVCWKTRPRNITNMLSNKKSSMLIISVSERHSILRNLLSHCTYVINYSYSYPCSEYSINQSLTWCYIPIIHSLIALPYILTVPTRFSYPCSEYSINTAHLMLHTNHSLTHSLTLHSYCTYTV
jgi:hypothetical protein